MNLNPATVLNPVFNALDALISDCRDMIRICGEKFRRMSCRMFRGHRVAVSRDSACPAARFERAAESLFGHGVAAG